MTNGTGRDSLRILCNTEVFSFWHKIALQSIVGISDKNSFLIEAIITLLEKQGTKRYISYTQGTDKANSSIINKGTVYYETNTVSNMLKEMYK